jgi:ribosomal protein S18 acetylase RimI-like enzyme
MNHLEIREAKTSDADEIGDLIRVLAEKFITHEFDPQARTRFLSSNDGDAVRKNMESGFSYHVAMHQGKIVGVVGLKDGSHLYHLFVAEEYQGAGLAREMWEKVFDESRESDDTRIFTVNSSNNAIGFYKKLGFNQSGPRVEKEGIQYNPMEFKVDC